MKKQLKEGYYLTDGGLETTLIFHQGIELPHFAAFELVTHPEGRNALQQYYWPYLQIAQKYGFHFILETPTWRANTDWAFKMGYSQEDLHEINRKGVRFMQTVKQFAGRGSTHVMISGNIGPRADGYVADNMMTSSEAKIYHRLQVHAFAEENADLVTAMTINYTEEAVGIVKAAEEEGLPVVVSFTVETDGCLPNGETLEEAIEKTDYMTDAYAMHYMINCAHPEHFSHVLQEPGNWKNRIRGIRANASTKSHAELDESESLDTGDKCLLADGYKELMQLLPELKVFGGCCGTDHSHLELICETVLLRRINYQHLR